MNGHVDLLKLNETLEDEELSLKRLCGTLLRVSFVTNSLKYDCCTSRNQSTMYFSLQKEYQLKAAEEKTERVPLGIALGFPLALTCLLLILAIFYYRRITKMKRKNEYLSKMHALTGDHIDCAADLEANFSSLPRPVLPRSARRKPLQTIFFQTDERSNSAFKSNQASIVRELNTPTKDEVDNHTEIEPSLASPIPTINLLDCDENGCKFIKSITPE